MITINDGLTQLNGLPMGRYMGSHADYTRLPHDVIYVFVAATLSCANVRLDWKKMFAHEAPAKLCVRFHFYASEFIHILEAMFFFFR